MKRVLVLANGTIAVYRFRRELLEALMAAGWEVWLSSPVDGFGPELEEMGLRLVDTPIQRHGTNPFVDLRLIGRYRRLIREIEPQVIMTYTIKPNIYGNLAAGSIPVISTVTGLGDAFLRSGLVNTVVQALYRRAFRRTHVVFQNGEDREIMRNAGILCGQPVTLVPGSGVNLKQYRPLPYPADGPVAFLYMGRLLAAKGVSLLIEVARKLKQEGAPAFELILIGYHDGDVQDEVTAAQNEGLLRHEGFQKDVIPFVEQAHCVVLPSYYREGLSNTLLEAAAMGRPLITTDHAGCREAVEDGANGFLCEPRDADSLYVRMSRFLYLSAEERRQMGEASRKKVEAEFDRNLVVQTMLKIIEQGAKT